MTARLDPIAAAEDIVREAFIGCCPWHLPVVEEEDLTLPLPPPLKCPTPLAPALLLLLDVFGLEFE